MPSLVMPGLVVEYDLPYDLFQITLGENHP